MVSGVDSLGALRDQAVAAVENLVSIVGLGVTLGAPVPSVHEIRRPFEQVGGCDIPGFLADSHRLVAAHRAVAEQLHCLPEQQIRLDQGWHSAAGNVIITAVVDHQRRAEADLHVLRTLSEATSAAAAGIDRLLRTWYLTVARLSQPLIGGVPVAEVPAAVLTGRLPVGIIIEDITSRCEMYLRSAHAAVTGVDDILTALNRATDDLDAEPYFSMPATAVPHSSADVVTPDTGDAAHPAPAQPDTPHPDDVPLRLSPPMASAPDDHPVPDNHSVPDDHPVPDNPQVPGSHRVPDESVAERTALTDTSSAGDTVDRESVDTGGDLALAGDQ